MNEIMKTLSIDSKEWFQNKKIKILKARYIERYGNIFLEKENGEIEKVGNSQVWNHIRRYEYSGKITLDNVITEFKGCPTSCGLCRNHKNSTALLNIVVTNACHIDCWYCFFHSGKSGFLYYPTTDDIIEQIKIAKETNGYYPPVQLTGGEPLIRDDLPDIIREIKKTGVTHIQLNTTLSQIGIKYYQNPDDAIDYVRELRKSGLNTIYTSFDGVTPETNPKNHYELPFAFEALKKGGIKSVVPVPVVTKQNLENIDKIVLFALKHKEIIRGVNFQPISILENISEEKRKELRTTVSDVILKLEEKLGIPIEAWYPPSTVASLLDLLLGSTRGFSNSWICGAATYIRLNEKQKIETINDYVDVENIYKLLNFLERYKTIYKLIGKSILPIWFYLNTKKDLKRDVINIIKRKDYDSAGEFSYKWLFLGIMHFMDPYNYDINRVNKCCIHYALPDKRIVPFCAYNVFPDIYRDPSLKKYSVKDPREIKKIEKRIERFRNDWVEFRRNRQKIQEHPIYQKYYTYH